MKWIYTLFLEDNKYYVGFTENLSQRMEQHFTGEGAMWTKKYKPIKVIEIVPQTNEWQEDFTTLVMMRKYGVENVRGGSWCSSFPLKSDPKNLYDIDPTKSLDENLYIVSTVKNDTTSEIDITSNILRLFREGRNEYEISQITGLSEISIETHIISLIKTDNLTLHEIGLTPDKVSKIEKAISSIKDEDDITLFRIKSICKNTISTPLIRYYLLLHNFG